MAAGVLRLSYFNVFGLVDESTYQGLALDNNSIILTALLYVVPMAPAILNVAPIHAPKLGGLWYYGLAAYILSLTAFFGLQLLVATG